MMNNRSKPSNRTTESNRNIQLYKIVNLENHPWLQDFRADSPCTSVLLTSPEAFVIKHSRIFSGAKMKSTSVHLEYCVDQYMHDRPVLKSTNAF